MPEPVSLDNQLFANAIAHYIDYHKPDPIARRQLESWTLNWTQDSGSGNRNGSSNNNDDDDDDNNDDDISNKGDSGDDWTPDRFLEGTLEICGEYVAVTLALRCSWAEAKAEPSTTTCGDDGRLSFVCGVASCRWIEEKEEEDDDDDDDDKAECKIRRKMIARLRKDSYISKLFAATASAGAATKNADPNATRLARASIYAKSSTFELEERVDVSEPVAESLRRALWSSAPSSLDVVEVVLALPSLPCFHAVAGTGNENDKNATTATTKLANRARLRMLEDAMLDECEKEGDERILEDLEISNTSNGKSNSNSNSTKPELAVGNKRKKSKR